MIDLKYLRENPDVVKKDLEKREDKEKLAWIDEILEEDKKYRELLQQSQDLRNKRNDISTQIRNAKKNGEDTSSLKQEAKNIPQKIEETEEKLKEVKKNINHKLIRLPNILDDTVPIGKSEDDNEVVEKVNTKPKFSFAPKDHGDLLEINDLVDLSRASKISGSRFYFLKNQLVEMDQALQRYGLDFMSNKNFTLLSTPLMMNREAYEGVTDLADFEEVMYNVKPEDFYLIATSEHPLTAMYMNETLDESKLPIKLTGLSSCFRRETGAHGKAEKGIWRVHQFNKVEQMVFCKPEESKKIHEELLQNAKEFFKSLGLHFRIVNICTADIGTVASKKYDIEAWMPSQNDYKEVVSCSNCTDYQANRLKIRYRTEQGNKTVHTLNSTCVATSRAMAIILENYQNEDGSITIPEVLRPYMRNKEVIKPTS